MLWWLSLALWAVLVYTTLIAVVIRHRQAGPRPGINGTWFLLTVSTESIAVLAALLLAARQRPPGLHCLAAFTLGLVLYLIVMTMVFLRWTFQPLDPTEADPPAWIAAGAVAITVLAGSNLLLADRLRADRPGVAPFIEGVVVLAWATATFWFPLMIAIGVWRHLVRRVPLRYHPSYWAGGERSRRRPRPIVVVVLAVAVDGVQRGRQPRAARAPRPRGRPVARRPRRRRRERRQHVEVAHRLATEFENVDVIDRPAGSGSVLHTRASSAGRSWWQ